MVHSLIPTHTLPVASQRSRACREVMEERRDIRFRFQHVWPGTLDHAPFPATASAEGAQFNLPPSPLAGKVGMALPCYGEGRLGANPTWSDCPPTPPGRTTLE